MSLKDCIDQAALIGKITRDEAEDYKHEFDSLMKRTGMTPGRAKDIILDGLDKRSANKKRVALLTEDVRKRAIDDISKYRTPKGESDIAEAFILKHEHLGGAPFMDAEQARKTLLSGWHEKLDQVFYQFRRGMLTGDKRHDPLSRFASRKVLARMSNVVRELFGEDSKDPVAKAMAKALSDVFEDARLRFNAAGGLIPKLDKWGMPQFHNRLAVLNAGMEAWIKRLMQPGVLDRDRMREPFTDLPLSDAQLREGLEHAWKQITTDGFYDYEPTMVPQGKGALWKQNLDHRFIHFKNADEWMKYAKDFGEPDPYAAAMAHIGRMAKDIGHMETFGPNPDTMRTYLKNYIVANASKVQSFEKMVAENTAKLHDIKDQMLAHQQKLIERLHQIPDQLRDIREKRVGMISRRGKKQIEALHKEFKDILATLNGDSRAHADLNLEQQFRAALDDLGEVSLIPWPKGMRDPVGNAKTRLDKADRIWELQRGAQYGQGGWAANIFGGIRNLITSSSLGTAAISSISDVATNSIQRGFVGMVRSKSNLIRTLVETLKNVTPKAQMQGMRAGLIADSMLHVFHSEARYAGSMNGRSMTGFLADRTVAISGMIPWTQGGKHGFGLAMQGTFADHIKDTFGGLPEPLRNTLIRHGITRPEWDQIRAATLYDQGGATLLRPKEIRDAAGDDLARKYIAMILRETQQAVIEPTLRTRAAMTGGTKAGTWPGEFVRSAGQFHAFNVAFVMQNLGHVLREVRAGHYIRGASYAASLLITTTVMGAVAKALRDIVSGKDPQPWTDKNGFPDPAFWGAAALQGGGLGIYGDFLFSGVNRFGDDLASTVAGPIWGRAGKMRELTIGNLQQLAQGKPSKFNAEVLRAIRANTPVVSSLWYGKLAYNRILLDQLQKLIDAEAQTSFNRQISRAKNETHQDYWWSPGESAPQRAPDISTILGK